MIPGLMHGLMGGPGALFAHEGALAAQIKAAADAEALAEIEIEAGWPEQ